MKKLLALAVVTLSLTLGGHADNPTPGPDKADVNVPGVWTGAWYQVLVPRGFHKQGGEINIVQDWDGVSNTGTLTAEEWYAREVNQTGSGTWSRNPVNGKISFRFVMDETGEVWKGTGNNTSISGTFSGVHAGGKYSGKWLAD